MNLDQVVESITASRAEYNLKPFFYIPLDDVEAVAYRHAAGLAFCYPRVSSESKEIHALQAYDIALANKLVGESGSVVCNDFGLEGPERIIVVTGPNLLDLAHGLHREQIDTALFLRAERRLDARSTFKLVEGEPLPTSYGEDSFQRVFGSLLDAVPS